MEKGFKKGHAKQGGRIAGTPNHSTTKIREVFADILENHVDQINTDLAKMKPVERINALLKLAEFCIPRLQTISGELFTPPQQITIVDGTD